ncbi:MAG: hypothetical protein V4450_05620 [Bacteroidota bacterium]
MKKILVLLTVLVSGFTATNTKAQVSFGLNINIGSQPIWGPVGYDHVDNYYLPDIDVFYNVPNRQYTYQEGGRWIFSAYLPGRYRNYDLYSGYKVVVNENRPYRNAPMYRNKYAGYKDRHDQQPIRNSHEQKYFQNKDHPEHSKWNNGRGNGKNDDQGDGKHDKDKGGKHGGGKD